MQLIPAIDLLNGAAVRLYKGDFEKVTRYTDDPVSLAREWARQGATVLHVVDLDGSRKGEPQEAELVTRLIRETGLLVQVAGGIRSLPAAKRWIDAGADAIVVGSLAVSEPEAVAQMVSEFGSESVVAAIDARVSEDGSTRVAVSGWTEDGGVSVDEALEILSKNAVSKILCTDIGRDGTKEGPNKALYQSLALKFPEFLFQASGGVGSVKDLSLLKETGVAGAIVGRALLDGVFSIEEALAC
ncbi:MAG: 1-(5-phosphoribosyl)-5-[(5-phosphoribosylamino)methylideneamino]imidazole-4-carboxamide isomerase [Elusimicrobia bacterium]|nr:MAG: 1-(5-phosphoribosyl)-5-[(5-phosphoribosylamino)methylideneamino]imidazole-4-carboxamide isomerase [Elusimicrobiota bacterium]